MRRAFVSGLAALGVGLAVALFAAGLPAQPPGARVAVHFIDVGQADAVLVQGNAGRCTILIDSGDTRYPESSANFRDYLGRHLPAQATIDLAIATHPHSDHIGSMRWVLETYRVKTYIDNGQEHSSALYRELKAVVRDQRQRGLAYHPYPSVPANVADVCGAGGPKLTVLYPQAGLDPDLCEKNQNNCSVVTKLSLGSTSFLFPGDAEYEEEELLLADSATKAQLDADVLKVGHHGSDTSSGEEFLDAVSPAWMVISAGEKDIGTNRGYKHPRLSTIRELLTFAGARVHARMVDAYDRAQKRWRRVRNWGALYVTAKDGPVVLTSDGTNVRRE
jgi:competence protein ComEC